MQAKCSFNDHVYQITQKEMDAGSKSCPTCGQHFSPDHLVTASQQAPEPDDSDVESDTD